MTMVRNITAHHSQKKTDLNIAYNKLKHYTYNTNTRFSKLSASNKYELISFDAFVMFSRLCIDLSDILFHSIKYDYYKITATIDNQQIKRRKKYSNNYSRLYKLIFRYFNVTYGLKGTALSHVLVNEIIKRFN